MKRKEFDKLLQQQTTSTLSRLVDEPVGSEELSALVGCMIQNAVFMSVVETGLFEKSVRSLSWRNGRTLEGVGYLLPYTTSMDQKIPNENIVLLKRTKSGDWVAQQEDNQEARGRNPVLVCRLTALHAGVWREAIQTGDTVVVPDGSAVDEPVE